MIMVRKMIGAQQHGISTTGWDTGEHNWMYRVVFNWLNNISTLPTIEFPENAHYIFP